MKRKTLAFVAFGALVWLLISGANIVSAQGPVPANADPSHTLVFDNRPHYIPGRISLWYAFFYAGDGSPIVMKMFDATNTGLDFAVYTPEQVRRLNSEDKPFGRGTAKNVSCGDGKCQDSALTWVGATPIAGPYLVRVTNNSPRPQVFYLIIAGDSVRTGPPLQDDSAPPSQPATPNTTNPPTNNASPTNTTPENAAFVRNNQPQTILGNSGLWYRFDWNGDGSLVGITLLDGLNGGANFRVYTSDQVRQREIGAFVGEGSALVINCDTGKCLITDSSWLGVLPNAGTYYIFLYNANPNPLNFQFLIEGAGVTLGQ